MEKTDKVKAPQTQLKSGSGTETSGLESLSNSPLSQMIQRVGNGAAVKAMERNPKPSEGIGQLIQRIEDEELLQGMPEEEELLQGKFEDEELLQGMPEEEELLQGKFEDEELIQGKFGEEEPLQAKKENNTGLPDNLKAGVEGLSGMDMSDVKVHYNSSKPADVGALAYAQGTDIHVAPGQEQHLPHEAWHVVQQSEGRVKPTAQMAGMAVNDDVSLESEADVMGAKALQMKVDMSPIVTTEGNHGDIDGNISESHCSQLEADGTTQLYRDGYAPQLARARRAPNGTPYSQDTFNRPKFDDETKVYVFDHSLRQVANNPVSGRTEFYYQCNRCNGWFQYEAMQIGHRQTWENYVAETVPVDTAEAMDAYNDLNNLWLECSTCNTGHAFEEDMDEDYDEEDPLIDNSEVVEEDDEEALRILREEVIPILGRSHYQEIAEWFANNQ